MTFSIFAGLAMTGWLWAEPSSSTETAKIRVSASTASLTATAPVKSVASSSRTLPIPLPSIENRAFRAGETLRFDIKYEFITAGSSSLTVSTGPIVHGRPTLHLQSRAESNGFIDKFFRVRDYNASVVDAESLMSVQFHQNLAEGHYKVLRTTTIDYSSGTYLYHREYKKEINDKAGAVSGPVSDILSSFFMTRLLPLKPGGRYAITVFSDGDVYPLIVKVRPKTQQIKIAAGVFDCLVIDPEVKGDAIFKARDGKMTIWLTNDGRRIPVLIRSQITLGAFDAELVEMTGVE